MACEEISDSGHLCPNPEVSVVVVVYNAEKTIAKTLDSFLEQQTNFPFEIIVSDDASPDGTLEICKDYQRRHPDKIRVLWAKRNVGLLVNDARSKAHARGTWIAECDGDDHWVNPNKLQLQYDAVHREHAQFCVTRWYMEDIFTGERSEINLPTKTVLTARDIEKHYFQTNTFFYLRSIYEKIVRETPLPFAGDYYKSAFLSNAGKTIYLPDTTAVWYIGKGQHSGASQQKKQATIFMARVCLALYGPPSIRPFYAQRALSILRQFLMRRSGATPDTLAYFKGWVFDGALRLCAAAHFNPHAIKYTLCIILDSLRLRLQKR